MSLCTFWKLWYPHRWSHIPQHQQCDWHRSAAHLFDEHRWFWFCRWLILLVQNGHYFTPQQMKFFILFSFLLRAVEGGADVLPESVHGSHQLSIFLHDLSYWRVRKLLRWDEPRHGPLNLLGGQGVSRRHLPQHQCHTRSLIYLAGKWLYCR